MKPWIMMFALGLAVLSYSSIERRIEFALYGLGAVIMASAYYIGDKQN